MTIVAPEVQMLLLLTMLGCVLVAHPVLPLTPVASSGLTLDDVLAEPGVLEHKAIVSARWEVPLSGLLDLEHPSAAHLQDHDAPIVLPVHVLTHPTHGTFVVDTGVASDAPMRGIVRPFLAKMEVETPLADILAGRDLAGVLLTHGHLDHVLGLPDVPRGTPIYAGPGEWEGRSFQNAFTRSTYQAAFDGHAPITSWVYPTELGGIRAADVIGDGSLWALHTPGHTRGSTSYLARTTDGPMLFVGDTSHTRWGWENGVTPGTFTEDLATHRETLATLQAVVAAHPSITVYMGHELGDDTAL
jgi:N-acyl homoserine lactone hydrolase